MICKNCGEQIDDLSTFCPKCFYIVDINEHEKMIDEKIATGTIKKLNKKPKRNHIICEKCGANIKIPNSSCKHCTHIANKKKFSLEIQDGITNLKMINEKNDIASKNKSLGVLCLFVPLLGIILKFVYKDSNTTLSDLCFEWWIAGLGRLRLVTYTLLYILLTSIF